MKKKKLKKLVKLQNSFIETLETEISLVSNFQFDGDLHLLRLLLGRMDHSLIGEEIGTRLNNKNLYVVYSDCSVDISDPLSLANDVSLAYDVEIGEALAGK